MASYLTHKPTLPALSDLNRAYWTGGKDNTLKILRCVACHFYIHPPKALCPQCYSTAVSPVPVSGRGAVDSFTVSYQPWLPNLAVPFVFASIELVEQKNLRVASNIVDIEVDQVQFGQTVQVMFEQHSDVWIPLFTPSHRQPA